MSGIVANYLIVFLFIIFYFIMSTVERKFSSKTEKRIILTSIIIFSIFAGNRVIGTDINSYRLIFEEQEIILFSFEFLKNLFQYQIEPAFILLISYLKQLGLNFKVFLFISAIVPLLIVYRTITKSQKHSLSLTFLLFLLLYGLRGPLDVIRHFFASSIFLSALYSLSLQKNLGFFCKSLSSVFFHYSAAVTLLIRPFINFRWDIKRYITSFISLFLIGFLAKSIIVLVINNIDIDSTNRILFKFQRYIDSSFKRDSILLYLMWYLPIILNIVCILISLTRKTIFYKNSFLALLLNSQIIGSLIFIFFTSIGATTMANRLEFMLSIGSAFILKEIIINLKGKNRIIFIFIILYLLIYFIVHFLYLVQLRTNIL